MKITVALFCTLPIIGFVVGQNCAPDEFECANGRCLETRYVCDWDNDCGDGSDEPPALNPDQCPECEYWQFRCDHGRCINDFFVCDYDNDCRDGSDERQNCPPCPSDRISCDIGGCVPKSAACDRKNDCWDWSDEKEENCPCSDSEIRCSSSTPPGQPGPPGACIPQEFLCDSEGIWDCPDGGDEANCTTKRTKETARRRHQGIKLLDIVRTFNKGLEEQRLKSKIVSKMRKP